MTFERKYNIRECADSLALHLAQGGFAQDWYGEHADGTKNPSCSTVYGWLIGVGVSTADEGDVEHLSQVLTRARAVGAVPMVERTLKRITEKCSDVRTLKSVTTSEKGVTTTEQEVLDSAGVNRDRLAFEGVKFWAGAFAPDVFGAKPVSQEPPPPVSYVAGEAPDV